MSRTNSRRSSAERASWSGASAQPAVAAPGAAPAGGALGDEAPRPTPASTCRAWASASSGDMPRAR